MTEPRIYLAGLSGSGKTTAAGLLARWLGRSWADVDREVEREAGRSIGFDILDLGPSDAAEVLALATLTRPGPFVARTPELGDFVGVKLDGRLVAMAGERMKPDGFTEVSGVCTHPDHRGRGYAAALMRVVMGRIRGRGEVPFLHAYAENRGAIGIYEGLGFRFRRELVMTSLTAE